MTRVRLLCPYCGMGRTPLRRGKRVFWHPTCAQHTDLPALDPHTTASVKTPTPGWRTR